MPKTALEQWDETAANNTDMGGIDLSENVMRPPQVNNEMREHMAQVAKWLGDDTLASAATTDLGSVPGRYVSVTGTTPITAFGTIKAGTIKYLKFSGALTLTHNATSLILLGGANRTTAAGDMGIYVSEGSGNWREVAYQKADGGALQPITLGTAVASTSGTTIDFTGIPPWAKRVTISLASVSLSGTSGLIVQIGDSGGIETTGYTGYSTQIVATPGVSGAAFSTAFIVATGSSAAFARSGKVILDLMDASAFRWNMSATMNVDDQERTNISNGYKQLTATLDRVRIGSLNGTDTFDGGQINISYE